MIDTFSLYDFKCLHIAEMSFSNINIITGRNSSGKSSVIQALNLMSEHLLSKPENGSVSQLVSTARQIRPYSDYRNMYYNSECFRLEASTTGNHTYNMTFTPANDRMVATLVAYNESGDTVDESLFPKIYHLPASRQSNQDSYKMNPDTRVPLGKEGEFVVDFYFTHRGMKVPQSYTTSEDYTLEYNLNYWLQLLTGYSINVISENEKYNVFFVDTLGNHIRPSQVGTGVGFIAAVLMVCMCSESNSLIAIENPEIHLHPGAQAKLCEFLSITAKSGKQLLIESHSDHIINGILVNVKEKEIINNENLKIYFFDDDDNDDTDFCMKPYELNVSRNGRINNAPTDFFDQIQIDLRKLLDIETDND